MLLNIVAHLTSRHHNDYNYGFIVSYIMATMHPLNINTYKTNNCSSNRKPTSDGSL